MSHPSVPALFTLTVVYLPRFETLATAVQSTADSQIPQAIIAKQCQALPFGTATADRPGSHHLLQLGQLPLQADLVAALSASDKPSFLNSGSNTSHLASSFPGLGRIVAETETCCPEGVLGANPKECTAS